MRYFGILCAMKEQSIATTFTFGGNPVVSSKGTSYFNDILGTTLGAKAKGKKYSAAALTKMRGQIPRNPFFKGPAGSVPLRSGPLEGVVKYATGLSCVDACVNAGCKDCGEE